MWCDRKGLCAVKLNVLCHPFRERETRNHASLNSKVDYRTCPGGKMTVSSCLFVVLTIANKLIVVIAVMVLILVVACQ